MTRAIVAALVLSTVLLAPAGPPLAAAARLRALPDTVRVNVAGLGVTSAFIGSTGTVVVTTPDGLEVYRGRARTVSRRDVRRLEGLTPLPDRDVAPTSDEDRRERLGLVREARLAEHEIGPRAIVTVPFEVGVFDRSEFAPARVALSAPKVAPLRFTTEDGFLTFNGRAFRGTLEIALDDAGDMIVVNTVPTSEYLASVVGAEVPSSWMPEALAAQAIAARTYLITHLGGHGAYDLEGDVRDQAYGGVGTEADSAVRAVQRTAGVVATYGGAPIEALYSANAGGVTEDSENVYSSALPYLRSVASPTDDAAQDSSWGRTSWEWTVELTAPQLRGQLRARGVDVGLPERVEILATSATGRVMRARVTGTSGSLDVGKDRSRYYFDLRSTLFTVRREDGGGIEVVDLIDAQRIRALDILGAERLGAVYRRILGADRETDELRIVGAVYKLPDRFVFSGRGFGHGVGMSQWGAEGMARQGASAERILTHYYRGIALTSIGGA